MPIPLDDAERLANGFSVDYPGACELLYRLRYTTAELYGPNNDIGEIKGAYFPQDIEHNGRIYHGRVDIPLDNLDDEYGFLATLWHEVPGCYRQRSPQIRSCDDLREPVPDHFTEDFILSVATKLIFGIDEMYWRDSVTKMRVSEERLAWIKPQKSMRVQLKTRGETRNDWRWTLIQQGQ